MSNIFFTGTREQKRSVLQVYVLLGLGLIFLLGALFLHLNPFADPLGLFLFGLGLLVSAAFNPSRLAIAGVFYTLVGAAIFIAFKPIIPYDNGLVVIAVGLALLAMALLARRGYIGAGAVTPGVLVFLVGLLLYPPTGRTASRLLAPFILSLWFPGTMLLFIGLVYWFLNIWKTKRSS
jgi:hypothetical protein